MVQNTGNRSHLAEKDEDSSVNPHASLHSPRKGSFPAVSLSPSAAFASVILVSRKR